MQHRWSQTHAAQVVPNPCSTGGPIPMQHRWSQTNVAKVVPNPCSTGVVPYPYSTGGPIPMHHRWSQTYAATQHNGNRIQIALSNDGPKINEGVGWVHGKGRGNGAKLVQTNTDTVLFSISISSAKYHSRGRSSIAPSYKWATMELAKMHVNITMLMIGYK